MVLFFGFFFFYFFIFYFFVILWTNYVTRDDKIPDFQFMWQLTMLVFLSHSITLDKQLLPLRQCGASKSWIKNQNKNPT